MSQAQHSEAKINKQKFIIHNTLTLCTLLGSAMYVYFYLCIKAIHCTIIT